MSSLVERVYVGRDDPIDLLLTARNENTLVEAPVALASFDRMVLVIQSSPAVTVDSSTQPSAIDWTDPDSVGRVRLVLGKISGIPSTGVHNIRLTGIDGVGKSFELIHEDMYLQSGPPQLKFVSTSALP